MSFPNPAVQRILQGALEKANELGVHVAVAVDTGSTVGARLYRVFASSGSRRGRRSATCCGAWLAPTQAAERERQPSPNGSRTPDPEELKPNLIGEHPLLHHVADVLGVRQRTVVLVIIQAEAERKPCRFSAVPGAFRLLYVCCGHDCRYIDDNAPFRAGHGADVPRLSPTDSLTFEVLEPAAYPSIADYAIIGDCHTAALISNDGSIDWYCPGRFDAPAVFCRLLDVQQGGFFSIRPVVRFTSRRAYRGHTNVLDTTFQCESGAVIKLTDFMPIHRRTSFRLGPDVGTSRQILRVVEGTEAPCVVEALFKPTFDFARGPTDVQMVPGKGAVATDGLRSLVLYCPKLEQVTLENGVFRGQLSLRPGERSWLALSLATSPQSVEHALDPDVSIRDLERTMKYWEDWADCCRYQGRYKDEVLRSALTIKLLTYEPSGAVVAAPTTSLPEQIGGIRNWDYRYAWLRDASLMLYALSTIGYYEEATDFMGWLGLSCGYDRGATPQIMYTVDGERELSEYELPHLSGYRGSRPVRVGNAASRQRQLDIYGDVLSAAYQFRHNVEDSLITPSPRRERMSRYNWWILTNLVDEAANRWQEPDSGIWEVRGPHRQYVYSKLMCWTALDRGIRLAQEQRMPAPLERWTASRDEIARTILARGYNERLGAFTQALDDDHLDASVLAIPRFGLLPSTDRRMLSTIRCIQEQLTRDGLVDRYLNDDGLPGSEGTFALCSFWLVDAIAMCGRLDEARSLFEKLLSYANDVGLLSEQIDPFSPSDQLLGNFPQGFSHLALISSAVNLANVAERGPERSAQTEAERAVQAAEAAAGPVS